MRIPINVGVKGRVTATLTNTETGEKQEVKGDNLILNHYLDWAMERGLGVLGTTTFNRCYIGTSDVPPKPTDITFVGTQLAMSAESVLIKDLESTFNLFNPIKFIDAMHISEVSGLAVTQSDDILILARDADRPDGVLGVEAFLIDKQAGNLSPLSIDAFSFSEDDGVTYQAISTGGNYLFVGLSQAPYGKLFEQAGNNFIFVSDIPGLSSTPLYSDISFDGNYLVVGDGAGRLYKIADGVVEFQSNVGSSNSVRAKFSPGGRLGISYDNRASVSFYDLQDDLYVSISSLSVGTGVAKAFGFTFLDDNLVAVRRNSSSAGISTYRYEEGTWNFVMGVEGVQSSEGSLDALNNNILVNTGSSGTETRKVTDYGSVYGVGVIPHLGIDFPNRWCPSIAFTAGGEILFLRVVTPENSSLGIYFSRNMPLNVQRYSRQWTFPAGTGTGMVNRIGLQANSGTGASGNNRHVAQIVLPEPLEKTNLHQLDVIWEIEVENPGVWEGVILGGSRDGSDLAWRVTINEEQFFALVSTGYSIPANWFGVTGTPNVRIGTSNEESNLMFDQQNIRGEEIQYISSTALREVNPYVPGSLKRTIRLFLEVNQGNGQIGEIVLGGSTSANSLARITFDPPLDKPPDVGEGAHPYRVYLDLEIGWQRGESDA